jgi:Outer membrane protein beta-barrel domain
MRTTLTFILAVCLTSVFAQSTDTLPTAIASTEFIIGVNNTSVSSRNASIIDAYGDNGFQVGIIRKYPVGKRSTFSFGMNFMTAKHQLTFKGKTVAFDDQGIRAYNNLYFRVPVQWTISPKANSPFYVSAGLNLSSTLQNRSTETFLRTSYMDDAGTRYDKPVEKNINRYREVASLDLGIRIGTGVNFNFAKTAFSAGVFYNQGLLVKDMGFRQRQIEFQLGMTLPSFKRVQKETTHTPGYWMN